MPDEASRIYWDANVLLSYINNYPDRVPIIEELFRQARAGDSVQIAQSPAVGKTGRNPLSRRQSPAAARLV